MPALSRGVAVAGAEVLKSGDDHIAPILADGAGLASCPEAAFDHYLVEHKLMAVHCNNAVASVLHRATARW